MANRSVLGVEMVPVRSSNVEEVGYRDGVLLVRFRSGGTYRYRDVPPDVHAAIMGSASKGQAVRYLLVRSVSQYSCDRLTPEEIAAYDEAAHTIIAPAAAAADGIVRELRALADAGTLDPDRA